MDGRFQPVQALQFLNNWHWRLHGRPVPTSKINGCPTYLWALADSPGQLVLSTPIGHKSVDSDALFWQMFWYTIWVRLRLFCRIVPTALAYKRGSTSLDNTPEAHSLRTTPTQSKKTTDTRTRLQYVYHLGPSLSTKWKQLLTSVMH